ncbi:MAG: UpxY family transcription antiterminator [Bryobacteraceae bacterium]
MNLSQTSVQWFAIRVKPNFERTVDQSLNTLEYETYLPMAPQIRQWSDRVKELLMPIFPGYLFCRSDPSRRISILRTPGVLGFLNIGSGLSCIPDVEIESLRLLLNSGALARPFPHFQVGEQIRIEDGPLKGLEGILQEIKNGYRIIVSITLLQRSIAAEVDSAWLRSLHEVKRAS